MPTPALRPSVRTRTALAATLFACLIAVTGCSSDAAPEAETGESFLPAAEGTTEYPLTLSSPFGDTVLSERPDKIAIVTASTLDTDALIALGGTPVFAPSTVERNPWLPAETVSRITTLWESEQGSDVSAEKVAASSPDLIVALSAYDTFDQNYYDQLSSIAPVLYAADESLSWQDMTTQLGETVDLSAAATEAVARAEQAVADTRDAHPEFADTTAAHVIAYEEEWGAAYVSAPGTDTAALFEDLGFSLPDNADQFSENDTVSDELIGLIDADFLLISTFEEGTESYLVDSELFTAIPAVADGRVVYNQGDQETGINYFAWGLNVQSALSVPWLVDQLADFGAEALG
ncbi:MAG: ABC transporter substrate-binding protein [Mycetocola sp.]